MISLTIQEFFSKIYRLKYFNKFFWFITNNDLLSRAEVAILEVCFWKITFQPFISISMLTSLCICSLIRFGWDNVNYVGWPTFTITFGVFVLFFIFYFCVISIQLLRCFTPFGNVDSLVFLVCHPCKFYSCWILLLFKKHMKSRQLLDRKQLFIDSLTVRESRTPAEYYCYLKGMWNQVS